MTEITTCLASKFENPMNFISDNPENGDYNQYWYSSHTINKITEELEQLGGRIAFLSTPSLYFSLSMKSRENCKVFDYDRKWSEDPGFIHYDYNFPDNLPIDLMNSFDVVVIDPPFITHEVWEKYAQAAKFLLKPGVDDQGQPYGKIIGTTVIENSSLLCEILGLNPTKFQPSIPNLVYQYHLFTNYTSAIFDNRNPEIPE